MLAVCGSLAAGGRGSCARCATQRKIPRAFGLLGSSCGQSSRWRRGSHVASFDREYLREIDESQGVKELYTLLVRNPHHPPALLCYEANPSQCHRRLAGLQLLDESPSEFEVVDINVSLGLDSRR